MTNQGERAQYGAAAWAHVKGELPNPFPRVMGPNATRYLQEFVDSGMTVDLMGRFEQALARRLGVKHAIGTPGCTPALAVLAAAFGFSPGDEIIVSPISDYGTVQGLIRENYIPVFADAAPGTVNLSAATIEPCITDRTRAILCVHKTGLVCDMDPINELAVRHGLVVYEDACQAFLSDYRGRLAGTLGRAAAFSFDAEKTMGADVGGAIVTDDDALAERARFLGQSRGAVAVPGYGRVHSVPGYAYRMPHCTAAIALAQLEIVDENVAVRDRVARRLTDLVARIPGVTPLPIPEYQATYSCWMFGISIDPAQFDCAPSTFAEELAGAGLTGAGMGEYYLLSECLPFLKDNAARQVYPYSCPPASRRYTYGQDTTPVARDFLRTFIRWSTICEKYTDEHCDLAAAIIAQVAARHHR